MKLLTNRNLPISGLAALSISLIFLTSLFLFLEPHWETNDDVALSMVAHGYGFVSTGSSLLVFSNVIWGWLVRLIPEVSHIPGYSLATISVLFIVSTTIVYGLIKLGLGLISVVAILVLITVRAALLPQFTINSGLLMVSAVVCWRLFSRNHLTPILIVGCLLAYLSYLIRSLEFFLVLLVALPLLPWETIRKNRKTQICTIFLSLAISSSALINHYSYQTPSWSKFNELNEARASFTDYGAGSYLSQRKDILEKHGYSQNDISLVAHWFFIDPSIANADSLNSMLKELGPLQLKKYSLSQAWKGVAGIWSAELRPIVIAALLTLLLWPHWRVLVAWGIFIGATFLMGLLGRPGLVRVYMPVTALLLLAPLLLPLAKLSFHKTKVKLASVIFLIAAYFNASTIIATTRARTVASTQLRAQLNSFPTTPVVLWGGSFPFEIAYPVLQAPLPIKMLALGVLTFAPYSLVSIEEIHSRPVIDLLRDPDGMPLVAVPSYIKYLTIYCNEHHSGNLEELKTETFGTTTLGWYRCL